MANHTKYMYECEKFPDDLARVVERRMGEGWVPLGAPVWQQPYRYSGSTMTVEGWYQFLTRE